MAVLPRKLQVIFGGTLSPSGNIAQPGSTVAGTTVYDNDLDILQNIGGGSTRWLGALQSQVVGTESQVLEELNGILLVITQQLAYLLERGSSEWLATQTYYENAIAYVDGNPYRSLQDTNLNHDPTSEPTWWAPGNAVKTPGQLSAFVVFDATDVSGGNCAVLNSSNIDHIEYVSVGKYRVHFIEAMTVDGSDGIYGFSGSAGTRNGATGVAGDNNIICGGLAGQTGEKTATTCLIYNWDANVAGVGTLEDSNCISISFFG